MQRRIRDGEPLIRPAQRFPRYVSRASREKSAFYRLCDRTNEIDRDDGSASYSRSLSGGYWLPREKSGIDASSPPRSNSASLSNQGNWVPGKHCIIWQPFSTTETDCPAHVACTAIYQLDFI